MPYSFNNLFEYNVLDNTELIGLILHIFAYERLIQGISLKRVDLQADQKF